jgi:glutamate decarboxylase
MSTNVHVFWKKAARFLEIEERYCSSTENTATLVPQKAVDLVNEDTVLVCSILRSMYTGEYDDVCFLDNLLQQKNSSLGIDVGIHVAGEQRWVWNQRLGLC